MSRAFISKLEMLLFGVGIGYFTGFMDVDAKGETLNKKKRDLEELEKEIIKRERKVRSAKVEGMGIMKREVNAMDIK